MGAKGFAFKHLPFERLTIDEDTANIIILAKIFRNYRKNHLISKLYILFLFPIS